MTLGLEWTGQDAYRNEQLREWLVDGEVAGKVRAGGGLTFATIDGAGHMVRFSLIGPSSPNCHLRRLIPVDSIRQAGPVARAGKPLVGGTGAVMVVTSVPMNTLSLSTSRHSSWLYLRLYHLC